MNNKTNTRNRRRARTGSAAVETAIILPLLIMMAIGFFEYGWHIHNSHILHSAARRGARAAADHENSNAEVTATVQNFLSESMGIEPNDVNVKLTKLNNNGSEGYAIMNLNENENGEPIRVTVTVQNNRFRGLFSMFLAGDENLSVSATIHRNR